MSVVGSFAFQGMTVEVQRSPGPLNGSDVYWLCRIAPEPKVTIAIWRNGRLAVSWEAGFKEASVAYAALTMAFDDFLTEHREPA
jgi:hypothetical protein